MGKARICVRVHCVALCWFWLSPGSDSWLLHRQKETAQENDRWVLGVEIIQGWLGLPEEETHLESVPSDPPVKKEGKGGTLEADCVGQSVGMGVRLCPDIRCIGGILLREVFQEKEGSTRVGEGEDSVGCRGGGAGKWGGLV